MTEHELYQDDKTTWACLLLMKYTQNKAGWEGVRESVREALGEEGMGKLRAAWKDAAKDGLI